MTHFMTHPVNRAEKWFNQADFEYKNGVKKNLFVNSICSIDQCGKKQIKYSR